MVFWKPTRKVLLNIPDELLVEVDEAANQNFMSRSEYIRRVLHEKVHGKYPKAIERAEEDNFARFADLNDS